MSLPGPAPNLLSNHPSRYVAAMHRKAWGGWPLRASLRLAPGFCVEAATFSLIAKW